MSLQASRQRQVTAWMVAVALLIQVLVPFGQAMALDLDADLEYKIICTADGIKQISITQDGQPLQPTDVEACVFCVAHMAAALAVPQNSAFLIYDDLAKRATYTLLSQQTWAGIWQAALPSPRALPYFV